MELTLTHVELKAFHIAWLGAKTRKHHKAKLCPRGHKARALLSSLGGIFEMCTNIFPCILCTLNEN